MTEKLITETEAKLSTHEQICSVRYDAIHKSLEYGTKRMNRIEYLLYGVIVAVLFGPGVAAEFFKKFLGL
jgi:hypothetical protein